jgi:hypothetical protein
MISVDIAADLNDEDETGYVWTFLDVARIGDSEPRASWRFAGSAEAYPRDDLDEARDPALIAPGAIVVAGDPDSPAVAEVVDLVDKPAGRVVHLRLLPGAVEDYEALVRRVIIPA